MSKETDVALKNLLIEILDNIEPNDVLLNAGLESTAALKRSTASSIKKVKTLLGSLSAEAEAAAAGGTPYKNTFLKDVKSVTDVRMNGRKSKDGVPTPMTDWGGYELLSYFFDLYYSRTGKEYPLECPGVTYMKYVKAKNKWEQHVTRGLAVMSRLIKALDGADQVKAYIDWWFMTSFAGKPITWGWLASATMIATFTAHLATMTTRNTSLVKDSPLPADFVDWLEKIPNIHAYVGAVKTQKQLKYVYNAWRTKMCEETHPVITMLREAMSRGLLQELT